MITLTSLNAVFGLAIGVVVLWANPRRFSNQMFAVISAIMIARYSFIVAAMSAGARFAHDASADPVVWLRAVAAITAFAPWGSWLLVESLEKENAARRDTILRSLPLFAGCAVLAVLSYTDLFIPADSHADAQKRGIFYHVYNLSILSFYVWLIVATRRRLARQAGVRRLETLFVSLNLGVAAFLVTLMIILGSYLPRDIFRILSLLIVFFAYSLTAWAIAYYRVFDARHVFLGLAQRLGTIAVLAVGTLAILHLSAPWLTSPVNLAVGLLIFVPIAFWLDRKSRRWLRLDGEEDLRDFRSVVITIARLEPHPELLTAKFEALLCERCNTPFTALLFDHDATYTSGTIQLTKDRPGYSTLCETGWATPENLQRRRPNTGIDDLQSFLATHALALAVTAPRGTPNPSLILVASIKSNQSPFTYPEVQRLQNIAELMDNILTHARLTAQAALEAKMQHLALMSRGLAHDLKNLITPVSAFLVHTDGRFATNSPEGEVHTAAKRSVRLMTDYVREALFFSSRLSPRFEETNLAQLCTAAREASAARAAERSVKVAFQPIGSHSLTVDAVLVQRLIGNLINNAIDASPPGKTVTLQCAAVDPGRVRFEVIDRGCGIPPENLAHIFEPYFTTKQFGDEIRGFGLGLTICERIVNLHQGTILVKSEVDRGTCVTVELPSAPSAYIPRSETPAPA
jgi:signal transduction histidine kinase